MESLFKDWHTYVLLVGKDLPEEERLNRQTTDVTVGFRVIHAHHPTHDMVGLDMSFQVVALVVVKIDGLSPTELRDFKPLILENRERVLIFVEDERWNEITQGYSGCGIVRSSLALNATIEFRLGELKRV